MIPQDRPDRPGGDAWRVAVGEHAVAAEYEPPAQGPLHTLFVCAHGAGGHLGDTSMLAAAAAMRGAGLGVLRFNFVYREQKSNRPDPMPRVRACFDAVVADARARLAFNTLVIGGRSMGGRAASMMAADGYACDALLLLAYPLHPAGQTNKLRDAHLPRIGVPVLCFNGTRDALCERPLMENTLATLGAQRSHWTMHWLDGADHSFHVLKSSGRTDAAVMAEVAAATRSWLAAHVTTR